MPLIFVLNNDQVSSVKTPYKSGDFIKRNDLNMSAQVLDWYLNGEPVSVYNYLLRLKNLRKDGKMTQEEIEFKEKISRNIYPGMYGGEKAGVSL